MPTIHTDVKSAPSQSRWSAAALAAAITHAASQQTYYTIRFLVDRARVADAYRTYGYFRWVDDWLDQDERNLAERLAFVERQQALVDCGYRKDWPRTLVAEEQLLVDLIQGDREPDSGLQTYIRYMMAVMTFDAKRRGQLISGIELNHYTHWLAIAVTEALHYFIGHQSASPHDKTRYRAVTGAHITHMLRDTLEDVAAGYFNIPREYIEAHHIDPCDVHSAPYLAWVRNRVQLARRCFKDGGGYLNRVENPRCRLAGYAYMARFDSVLDTIEADGYRLRSEYPDRHSLITSVKLGSTMLLRAIGQRTPHSQTAPNALNQVKVSR